MSKSNQKQIIAALLERYGRTFASELGIDLESEAPTSLFRWLCTALLFSARIGNAIAVEAARALTKSGWTTAKKMAGATWEERTHVLNHAGYARTTRRRPRMLADTSELLLKRYDGDLRKLREVAEREPAREKELECKDIGPVGADIFLREVQVAWMELQRSRRRENPRAGALAAWKCSSKRCVRVSRIRFATRSRASGCAEF